MMPYLLKTEPGAYSFTDLQRERETIWDGVTNPQAVKYLRAMRPKEKLVLYHSGDVRAAVGLATVVSVDASNIKAPLVRVRCGKALPAPKGLDAVRQSPLFADSPLVRQGRLSVVPLTEEQYQWFLAAE